MQQHHKISDLAKEFDITTRTIRFYEDHGLLTPKRKGQQRIYSARDRVRLKLVLRGKRLGFSLQEIADIISLYDAEAGEVGQLEFFLNKISERKSLLEQQREDIDVTVKELKEIEKHCRKRLQGLE